MHSPGDDVVSIRFRKARRDEVWLLPPSIEDWLPEGHLARFIALIVETLDLDRITGVYRHGGKPAYCPVMMTALLFYGYATGTHSSRKLEAATHDSVAVRFVTGNLHEGRDTIARFRKRHLTALQEVFFQVLAIARLAGVLKLGHVSLDGTKVKRHRAMSFGHMQRIEAQLKEEVARLLEMAEAADTEECHLDISEELGRREDRLAKIAEARAEIEARAAARHVADEAAYEEKMQERGRKEKERGRKLGGRPPKPPVPGARPKDQISFTDPDSRIMPSSGGFEQAYNAQASVDHESHLIAHAHVSQSPNDVGELAPALAALEDAAGDIGQPAGIVADTGYHSRANVELCEEHGIEPLIASGRQHHNRPLQEKLDVPPEPPADADALARMKHRMGSAEGMQIYAKRKATALPVFGIIKRVMGFDRFSLRGIEAVRGEWSLACTSWNLKRMHRLLSGGAAGA